MFKCVILKKVEVIEAAALSPLRVVSSSSCVLESEPSFTEININELADVKLEDSLENNQRKFTTTLSFLTCDKTPSNGRRLAYRLTAADGTVYMVGTKSRPFPITTESNPFPGKPTESPFKKVTVKWVSPLPMLTVEE